MTAPFVWYNPKTWSAPAQSIALVVLPIIVAVLNKQFSWNIDADTIKNLFWGGVAASTARAVIDHGEPPETAVTAAAAPKPVPTTEEQAVLDKFRGLGLIVLLALALTACSTGIGRGVARAVEGVPPTIPSVLDEMEAEYDLRAGYEMHDIVGDPDSQPQTAEGIIKQAAGKTKLESRMADEHAGFAVIRTYIGVEKGASPTASAEAAEKTRAAALSAVLDRIAQAKLEAAAKKAAAADPKPDASKDGK